MQVTRTLTHAVRVAQPREQCTQLPLDYRPPRWNTKVLQHTRTALTWDDDDPERLAVTTRQWSVEDVVNEVVEGGGIVVRAVTCVRVQDQFRHLLPSDDDEGSEFSSAGRCASM
jgi:hypothetical protein